jgi:hypothetical protein
MSNYKAIAVVTAALRNRLTPVCEGVVRDAKVTTVRPDISGAGLPQAGVNLFLYQITPNTALRNADLPTRRADGTALKHPTAALNLHYLISFYGNDQSFETQILLGAVTANLHAFPALSRLEIQQVFSAVNLGTAAAGGAAAPGDQTITELADVGQAALFDPSGLADAHDLVRFTPTELSLEELSKLWSVFLDTPYVLSVIYEAGPVKIEETTDLLTSAALPVMLPARIRTLTAFSPVVAQVFPTTGVGTPIVAGSALTVAGTFFPGIATTVSIDGVVAAQVPPTPTTQPPQPQTTITPVPLPATLLSGAHTLQITQAITMGKPGTAPTPVSSNVAGFVLQPTISAHSLAAFDPAARAIDVAVNPAVSANQTVRLLVNRMSPGSDPANPSGAYLLETSGPHADGATTFSFATTEQGGATLPSGSYLVRVQVDGVDSMPSFGPTGFTDPQVVIP